MTLVFALSCSSGARAWPRFNGRCADKQMHTADYEDASGRLPAGAEVLMGHREGISGPGWERFWNKNSLTPPCATRGTKRVDVPHQLLNRRTGKKLLERINIKKTHNLLVNKKLHQVNNSVICIATAVVLIV